MNKRSLLILALIVLAFSALTFFSLTRGHFWWDDFASYVMQAQAILDWKMDDFIVHNTFTIQNSSYPPGPVAYPWGFPLLLTPVVALFGVHPLALKLVEIAFYVLFLIVFFFLARTRLEDWQALLLTAVFAFNPNLIAANNLILSDLPFMAVSTFCLLLIQRWEKESKQWWLGLTLGFSIFFASFLRTNGILLLVPLAVSLLVAHWPDWKTALKNSLVPLVTFAALFLAANLIFPNGQDSYLSHFSMFNLPRLWENFVFYLGLPSWTFETLPLSVIFYPVLAIFLFVSLFGHWKRDLALHSYTLATLALFTLWPERQGLRFIYPILPLLFIPAAVGMNLVLKRFPDQWQRLASGIAAGFWVLLLLLSLGVSVRQASLNMAAGREINGPFDPVSMDLYNYIRTDLPSEAVVIFVRPRAMRLFTGRDSFMTENCADLPKGDYIALNEKVGEVGQISPEQIAACPGVTLEEVYNNRRFVVYRINP